MGNGPIRVLQIHNNINSFGGVEAMILNIYRHIDHGKVQFDILNLNESTFGVYEEEVIDFGGNVYSLNLAYSSGLLRHIEYAGRLYKFLQSHRYDIVHTNSGKFLFQYVSAIVGRGKRAGKTQIIVHSHNSWERLGWKKQLLKPLQKWLLKNADRCLACSEQAAYHLFPQYAVEQGRVQIIKNGIDTERFSYDEAVRNEIRKELGLGGKFVIGHSGRFDLQKNHVFLMDIFAEVCKEREDARLLLVGDGSLMEDMQTKARILGLEEKVLFVGRRNDVERFYQAMDVFVFPSLHEGLPVALIEAQCSGLPCVIADTISQEAAVTELIRFQSLTEKPAVWARQASDCRKTARRSHKKELEEAGYSIRQTARQLEGIYHELVLCKRTAD